VTADRLAERLDRDQRRVLLQLDQERGTVSPARAFELKIRKATVEALAALELAQVDDTTGDLELTPAGLEVAGHLGG